MDPERIFSLASAAVMPGWLVLVFLPRWRHGARLIVGVLIPALLGGPDTLMIGRVLWDEFFSNRDWPVASAVAIALLLLLVVPIVLFQHAQAKNAEAGR